MTEMKVVRIERLELAFSPRPWAFAAQRRAEINAYFARLRRDRPALWNGRVLLLHRHRIDGPVFEGAFLETDFASFIAWRDWGFPDAAVTNCFAMGALRGSDGAYLLGCMAPHTAGAGRIYFPSGTPDPDDVAGGSVDLGGSVLREIAEETGLTSADLVAEAGWYSVLCGPRIAQMKILQAHEPAEALRTRIRAHLRSEPEPELSDVMIVRTPADLDPRIQPFVSAFLMHVWSR
jgi:hypothetical protein